MDTIEYATFRYDTVEVENGLNNEAGFPLANIGDLTMRQRRRQPQSTLKGLERGVAVTVLVVNLSLR